ncbi:MAG: NAD(P)H-dependent oxidoreductase [Betaproteobacteria bacterium]|nr:NAD(P)H-dependent oxidoreductase [Betaproteobacteria bacterium]
MQSRPFIVGIGGTTRSGSTSERALAVALARAQALGCDTRAFGAGDMPSEPYDPAAPGRSPQAQAMVEALRRADGVIIATPSYHGGISGLVKNAIDFTEDMRADPRVYLEGRAVGCIVCAEGAQAMGTTMVSLRAIVHALRGWPTPYGAAIASSTKPFGGPDRQPDPAAIKACETVGEEVARFALMSLSSRG